MYKYRNKKTGEIIQTVNKVHGANWEQQEAKAASVPKAGGEAKRAAKGNTAKNTAKSATKSAASEGSAEKGGQ